MHGGRKFPTEIKDVASESFELIASFIAVKNVLTFDVTLFLRYGAYSHS